MIYIDTSELELPRNWENLAEAALDTVRRVDSEKRPQEIDRFSSVWKALAEPLSRLSNGKCWYCESKQDRSDMHVDHFRPKGRVAECETHKGYWWLAFNPANFRYSCTFCNSRRKDKALGSTGGKGDSFPLCDKSPRVFNEGSIASEIPILLDPTDLTDPMLLRYDKTGQALPRHESTINQTDYERSTESIRLLHLCHARLVRRRKVLHNDIEIKLTAIRAIWPQFESGDPSARLQVKAHFRELRRWLSSGSEYSAAARIYVELLREDGDEWLDQLLATN